MKWVTREKARVDRIACPWLITRFIDREPTFLFVPVAQVLADGEGHDEDIGEEDSCVELGKALQWLQRDLRSGAAVVDEVEETAHPAVFLWNAESSPTEVGDFLPERCVECVRALHQPAHDLGAALFGQKLARRAPQHFLLFRESEVHDAKSYSSAVVGGAESAGLDSCSAASSSGGIVRTGGVIPIGGAGAVCDRGLRTRLKSPK